MSGMFVPPGLAQRQQEKAATAQMRWATALPIYAQLVGIEYRAAQAVVQQRMLDKGQLLGLTPGQELEMSDEEMTAPLNIGLALQVALQASDQMLTALGILAPSAAMSD